MKSVASVIILFITFSSCAVYELPVSSFKARFADVEYDDFKEVEVRGPFGVRYTYMTHPSPTIDLVSPSGEVVTKEVKPSLEMRVTHSGGKRSLFYFDKVYATRRYLYGDQSRFIDAIKKKILLDSIEKIEVMDGKKNFKYVN